MPSDFANFVIPVWFLLVVYGLFLSVFSLYTLFNLYHLIRFGTRSAGLYAILALFLFGTTLLVGMSVAFLAPYDWSAAVSPSDLMRQTSKGQFFP
jgi:hypothetical protein